MTLLISNIIQNLLSKYEDKLLTEDVEEMNFCIE